MCSFQALTVVFAHAFWSKREPNGSKLRQIIEAAVVIWPVKVFRNGWTESSSLALGVCFCSKCQSCVAWNFWMFCSLDISFGRLHHMPHLWASADVDLLHTESGNSSFVLLCFILKSVVTWKDALLCLWKMY